LTRFGHTIDFMHAKTTNNTISLKAATSKVIEQMLPRSLSDIGMIHFRSRSKKLINVDINHRYENIAVDPIPVLHALGVLTGSAEGMIHPLNAYYRPRDTSEEHIVSRLTEYNACSMQLPYIDMTEDDNDDELENSEQAMKKRLR
jgi:hypothetical protein